jgi:transmembrane sensor
MINYRSHNVEELATDDMFRRWVMNSTPEISFFWQRWTEENPDRRPVVNQAKELVMAVHEIYKNDLSDEVLSHEIEEITRLAELRKQAENKMIRWPAIWRVAAVIVLVSGLGLLYYLNQGQKASVIVAQSVTENADPMLVRTNNDQQEMTVLLSDNSVATLSKGSSITFPKQFNGGERRVYLTGEAFFDVTKNPGQPFLVYTNETVTKVVGTSFRIKAFDQENTVMVVVKTGRVKVYPKNEYETISAANNSKKITSVVLDPNQQAVFIRNENRLEKGIVANIQMLSESILQKELIFDDKPVTQVLQALEKMYGIEIAYDTEVLADCVISAQFNDETLKQRMNAICQAIDASYDMVNGQIVITSKGCSQTL